MNNVPQQHKGAQSSTEFTTTALTSQMAEQLYEKARRNLLNVNNWKELAGAASATFTVIDTNGAETGGEAREGDYLRILLPVKSAKNESFDWVRVEKIEEIEKPGHRYIGMRVRPAVPPFYGDREVAHFFTRDATSTFCVEMQGTQVKAAVYGRNEKPNTHVNRLVTKIKNLFIAIGAMIGFNKPQWKSLVKGWLKND